MLPCLIIAGFIFHNKYTKSNIEMCGVVVKSIDMTQYHKSKIYERFVLIVDFNNSKRENVIVTKLTYLESKTGDKICIMKSIADIQHKNGSYFYEIVMGIIITFIFLCPIGIFLCTVKNIEESTNSPINY